MRKEDCSTNYSINSRKAGGVKFLLIMLKNGMEVVVVLVTVVGNLNGSLVVVVVVVVDVVGSRVVVFVVGSKVVPNAAVCWNKFLAV